MMLEDAPGLSLSREIWRPPSRDLRSRESGGSTNSRDGRRHYQDNVLSRVGVSVIGDGAELERAEMLSAQRVGLAAVEGNAEFSQRVVQEARDAEDMLEKLRRRAKLTASRCNGQLDVVDKDLRAEMEQRTIADNISRELEALRAEIRQKDAAQEEHLGHLYRAMAGPPPEAPAYGMAYAVRDHIGYRVDGAHAFPTLISSAVPLSVEPLTARQQEDEYLDRRRPNVEEHTPVRHLTERFAPRRRGEDNSFHRSQVPEVVAPPRGPDAGDALEMLKRNKEKLRYLERYGV